MMLGTAGLTAGLCVDALQKHDVGRDSGRVVVTGASGGVGSMAVALLAKLGYHVVAVTGKTSAHDYLRSLGAAEVLPARSGRRQERQAASGARWAGPSTRWAATSWAPILRAISYGGCVAACGNAAGVDLPMTVFPFILRGVTLAGIDAAWCPIPLRHETWDRLAGAWKLDCLDRDRPVRRHGRIAGPDRRDPRRADHRPGGGYRRWRGRRLKGSGVYEIFEHTADLGLRMRAGSLDELFADAGRALFSVIVANPDAVRPSRS